MDISVGKISSEARFFDPKTIQEIARIAARIVQEEQARDKRDEQDRRLTDHASSNADKGSRYSGTHLG